MELLTTRIIRPSRKPPFTPSLFVVPSTFGGTLRQSQIKLQAFVLILLARAPARTWNLTLPEGSKHAEWRRHGVGSPAYGNHSNWIGPILRSSPARTAYFSHRLLRRLLRHSLFRAFLCGKFVGLDAASSHRASLRRVGNFERFRTRRNFSIHSQVILRRTLTSAFRPGANVGPARLCRESFPQPTVFGQKLLP